MFRRGGSASRRRPVKAATSPIQPSWHVQGGPMASHAKCGNKCGSSLTCFSNYSFIYSILSDKRRPSWPHIWGRRWSRHSAAPSRRRPKRGCPQHNVTGTSVESSRRPGRVEGGGAAARCRARVSCWSTMSRPPGPRSRRAPACCVAAAWAKCGRSRWRESFAETSPTGEIVTLRVRARIGSRFWASYSYRVRPEPGARREHTGSSRARV